jgi:TPR repeat protein
MNMVNLAALTLLRNDPVVAEEFLQAATRGDVDAQYGMGLIYAEGRGVEQDNAKSFYWLTRAIEQGDTGADVLRKAVATGMTAEQYARVELLLQEDHQVRIHARGKDHR